RLHATKSGRLVPRCPTMTCSTNYPDASTLRGEAQSSIISPFRSCPNPYPHRADLLHPCLSGENQTSLLAGTNTEEMGQLSCVGNRRVVAISDRTATRDGARWHIGTRCRVR